MHRYLAGSCGGPSPWGKKPKEDNERYMALALVGSDDSEAIFHCPCTTLVQSRMELVNSQVAGVRDMVEEVLKLYLKAIRCNAHFVHCSHNFHKVQLIVDFLFKEGLL